LPIDKVSWISRFHFGKGRDFPFNFAQASADALLGMTRVDDVRSGRVLIIEGG